MLHSSIYGAEFIPTMRHV